MARIHPESLYKGPRIPFTSWADKPYDFDGFIEPWTEHDVHAASRDSHTGIKIPVVILFHTPKLRQGIYVTPSDKLRMASTRALSGLASNPDRMSTSFVHAVGAAFCRISHMPDEVSKFEWENAIKRGFDIDRLVRCLSMALGSVHGDEWWRFPSLRQLQIVRT